MEESEQSEETAESNSIDESIDRKAAEVEANQCLNLGPRRSSILKKSTDRPVAKSVSFSSTPGEKKVTNGKKFRFAFC